eukprot:COSAG05_NODE_1855_length_3955_cov_2.037863_1_plen_54_part_00
MRGSSQQSLVSSEAGNHDDENNSTALEFFSDALIFLRDEVQAQLSVVVEQFTQ